MFIQLPDIIHRTTFHQFSLLRTWLLIPPAGSLVQTQPKVGLYFISKLLSSPFSHCCEQLLTPFASFMSILQFSGCLEYLTPLKQGDTALFITKILLWSQNIAYVLSNFLQISQKFRMENVNLTAGAFSTLSEKNRQHRIKVKRSHWIMRCICRSSCHWKPNNVWHEVEQPFSFPHDLGKKVTVSGYIEDASITSVSLLIVLEACKGPEKRVLQWLKDEKRGTQLEGQVKRT